MSGSGGFFKYRCKNFYSHNCPNWVWVNHSPCATCLAEGIDDEVQALSFSPRSSARSSIRASRHIVVPPARRGVSRHPMTRLYELHSVEALKMLQNDDDRGLLDLETRQSLRYGH